MNLGGAKFRPKSRAMHPTAEAVPPVSQGQVSWLLWKPREGGDAGDAAIRTSCHPWGPMELRSIPPAYDYKHFDVPFGQLMWVHETEFTRSRGLALRPCPLGTS